MKLRKIILSISVFIFLLCINLGAQKPKVVASASIFADMAKQIGGDLINVDMIVPIGADPHLHDPTPKDASLVSSADLILLNGLTFEGWINELVENSGTKAKSILITEGVDAITSEVYENAADPHAWMDASNGLVYTSNIARALTDLLPEAKEEILASAEQYAIKIRETDDYIKNEIAKIPEKQRVLITSHDAFEYYGRRYGIELDATIGISTESDVQTSDIARVSKKIKELQLPAVFIESTINPKLMQQIAKDTGVKIGGELFADSLDDEGTSAGTYLGMLRHNTDIIVAALGQNIYTSTRIDDDMGSEASWLIYIAFALVLGLMLLWFFINANKN